MKRPKFKLWHSLLLMAVLLLAEGAFIFLWPVTSVSELIILIVAVLGSFVEIYIAMEIIEEVHRAFHMLALLFVLVIEFVVFFAFQYWYLLLLSPASFPTLASEPITLLLHSGMIFVFNPLYLPVTGIGQALLLINTLGALGLVLFILQNVWQIRSKRSA